jgi:hypothetical protein
MLLALAPLVALIAAAQEDRPAIEVYDVAFGKVYQVIVSRAALDKTPAWKDDADNPPLSPRKAIKLADEARARLFKDNDEWEWRRGSMELCDAGGGRWYWSAPYRAYYKDIVYIIRLPEIHLVVLMDGTVAEPTVVEGKRK